MPIGCKRKSISQRVVWSTEQLLLPAEAVKIKKMIVRNVVPKRLYKVYFVLHIW